MSTTRIFGQDSARDHEQCVVVVFDLYADTHHAAAERLADVLGASGILAHEDIEAWSLPEPQDKHIDGSEPTEPMTLTPAIVPGVCTCGCPGATALHGRNCDGADLLAPLYARRPDAYVRFYSEPGPERRDITVQREWLGSPGPRRSATPHGSAPSRGGTPPTTPP